MFRTIVGVLRCERCRLRTDQGVEKENYEQAPQCAVRVKHFIQYTRAMRRYQVQPNSICQARGETKWVPLKVERKL